MSSKAYNSADPDQVKQAEVKAKLETLNNTDSLYAIMQLKEGRNFVWWLLEEAGVFRTSFTGNSTTFFNEGQRNIGLKVMAILNEKCPDLYLKMLKENKR